MNDPKIRLRLRDILAELYPSEADIRRIVDDAGLKWQRIEKSTAINTWHSVLIVAEKTGKVEALLDVVEGEYGSNREFLTACAAYRQLAGKTAPSNLASHTLKNEQGIQVKPQRRRLPMLLLGLLLLSSVAVGGWYWNFFHSSASGDKEFIATTPTPYTSEIQAKIITITAVTTPTSPATATKFSADRTSIPTEMPTSKPTPTPQPTATVMLIPVPTYPCDAEILSPTGGDIVKRARAIPSSNGPLMPAVQAGILVEVREKFGGSEIWYHIFDKSGREFGWLLSNYLRLSSSCPR